VPHEAEGEAALVHNVAQWNCYREEHLPARSVLRVRQNRAGAAMSNLAIAYAIYLPAMYLGYHGHWGWACCIAYLAGAIWGTLNQRERNRKEGLSNV